MIEVRNLTTNKVDEDFLKGLAKKVLAAENKKIELSVGLVGPARIRGLNKKYRQKNKSTDVLSFQYGDSGEVVICLREVRKNAKDSDSDFKKELAKVLIHGILHILGYDHAAMKNKETRYLNLWLNKKSSSA